MRLTVPKIITGLVREAKVDRVYHAKVVPVEIPVPLSTSLIRQIYVHISEMAWTRTNRVEDLVAIGDEVDVKIIR